MNLGSALKDNPADKSFDEHVCCRMIEWMIHRPQWQYTRQMKRCCQIVLRLFAVLLKAKETTWSDK